LADAAVHAVIDAWFFERVAISEVRVKEVIRAAVDGELSRAHFQSDVCGLCALRFHNARAVF
jgi:hypothetical protein